MNRQAPSRIENAVAGPSRIDALTASEKLVSTAFDDSWSMLDQEVALIDRLLGGEIASLFERYDNGGGNVRG